MSDYLPLTRKSRPQNFDELIGQEAPSRTIKNALTAGKIHSAYLFTGPRGIGKTTLARILAKSLNCAKALGPTPCLRCDSCREIASSSSLDVLEMDAASNTGVDNVREAIIETVGLVPHRDRYKIFIIDEAHMLSNAAFNALLKTLEEPPPRVVFILATTEAAKIPPTIASRCQRFRFRPLSVDVLAKHLEELAKKENVVAEPGALALLARAADGAARDAVSLLDQCRSTITEGPLTENAVRDLLGFAPEEFLDGISKAIIEEDKASLSRWIVRIEEEGLEPAQVARDLRSFLHALYRSGYGIATPLGEKAEALKSKLTQPALSFLLRRLNQILEELRSSDSPSLTLEVGLFGCLETSIDIAAWVNRLEQLETRLSSGATPAVITREAKASADDSRKGVSAAPTMTSTPEANEQPSPMDETEEDFEPEYPAQKSSPLISGPPGFETQNSKPLPHDKASGKPSQIWTQTLGEIQVEKPALATALKKAKIVEDPGNNWRFIFARAFDSTQAKKNILFIETALSRATGSPAGVKIEAQTQDAPISRPNQSPIEEPLSKAQQILGGRFIKSSQR
jgi:DNA polymerase-3 subunit gamma/tau